LGFVDCTGEDDSGLTGEFVEEVDQINVLMLMWEEEVGLEECRDGLILICRYGDARRIG
jgi:hypothetical protein